MADRYPGLANGPVGDDAITVNYTASAALLIGAPVVGATTGTGELLPRLATDTTGTAFVIGVTVSGVADGVWVDGLTANDGQVASAAGDSVRVCTFGRCKVRVDGSTGGANSNIAVGDPLSCGAASIAQRAVASDYVFARALQTSSVSTDAIACCVTLEGIL